MQQVETEVDVVETQDGDDAAMQDAITGTQLSFAPSIDCLLRVPFVDRVGWWQRLDGLRLSLVHITDTIPGFALLVPQFGVKHNLIVQRVREQQDADSSKHVRFTEKFVLSASNPRGTLGEWRIVPAVGLACRYSQISINFLHRLQRSRWRQGSDHGSFGNGAHHVFGRASAAHGHLWCGPTSLRLAFWFSSSPLLTPFLLPFSTQNARSGQLRLASFRFTPEATASQRSLAPGSDGRSGQRR